MKSIDENLRRLMHFTTHSEMPWTDSSHRISCSLGNRARPYHVILLL